jgi:hypothetical protein
MKNIHILPTDKPSRLSYFQGRLLFDKEEFHKTFISQNIYITSDEEIKEGDWCYYENGELKGIHKVVNGQRPKTMVLKKIILTTDQDLIKDGVQAIDDEFLEWFVKNPSCESVEVITIEKMIGSFGRGKKPIYIDEYKIIIPNLEIWKDIPDFKGYYQISNLGNVISLNYGKIRELKPRLVGYDGNQYLAVNLSKKGKVKSVKIHKLVALCFLNHTSKGYDGLVIDHIDSNKLNNRLDNLKLVTPRFNASKDKQSSSSKFTGVTWHKKSKKWQCQIYDNGKLNHLGLFNTEIEASKTYNNYLENMTKEEPKQETLEEAAEKSAIEQFEAGNSAYILGFIEGAKWQQERSYSEKEVLEILFELSCNSDTDKEEVEEWFEQFKFKKK